MIKVAIAGAGLMGRLLAWRLLESGCRVVIFDRDSSDGFASCSWVGAGMLTPFAELERAELEVARLGVRALALWPEYLRRLPAPVFFQNEGSLVVAHRADWSELEAFERRIRAKDYADLPMLRPTPQRLEQLEPELAGRFSRALFFEGEGQLEPRQLLPQLRDLVMQHPQAEWHEGLEIQGVFPRRLDTAAGSISCDFAVDTRGLGARIQHQGLRGVRGEIIRFHAPDVHIRRPVRLIHPRYPLYIVPRPGGQMLIGATSIESDDQGPITVHSALELLSACYSLHPGFAEARVLETAVQCRPAWPDNNPKLEVAPGLVRINGLYRHGYLTAPALAEDARDFILAG